MYLLKITVYLSNNFIDAILILGLYLVITICMLLCLKRSNCEATAVWEIFPTVASPTTQILPMSFVLSGTEVLLLAIRQKSYST